MAKPGLINNFKNDTITCNKVITGRSNTALKTIWLDYQ